MAKTLANLRDHARQYLDEVSAADWTDAQVNRELNYAYMEMYTAVVETFEDYYREKFETDVVANQQEYELPDDFYKMLRLEIKYSSTDDYTKATPYNYNQSRRGMSDTSAGSSSRPLYDINGNFLRLRPIPKNSVTNGFLMWYIKQMTEMTADTDAIDIPFPDRFGKYIVIGACAELLRKGQQEEAVARAYDEKFQIGLEKMKQELENRYLDGTKSILDVMGEWNSFDSPVPTTTVYF